MNKKINHIEQKVFNYLCFLESPTTLDDLVDLTGISAVNLLNIMERLKEKNIIHEKEKTGKGVYFFDDSIKGYIKKPIQACEKNELINKIIHYYIRNLDDSDKNFSIIAELYIKVGDIPGGLSFIKKTADNLYRSGKREKAHCYYTKILQYFKKSKPVKNNVRIYLESLLKCVSNTFESTPLGENYVILKEAEQIAYNFQQWDSLAMIKFHLSRNPFIAGKIGNISKALKDFHDIENRVNDNQVRRTVALAKSELFYCKGRIREATECYDGAIGNLEEFGDEEITLRVSALVGWFYVMTGKISRGMGLISTVREKSNLFGYSKTSLFADIMKVHSLLEIRKTNDAKDILDQISSGLDNNTDNYTLWAINRSNAFIECSNENYYEALNAYNKGNEYISSIGWPLKISGWSLELLNIIESKGFLKGIIDIDAEIAELIELDDIYSKGFALRYRALRNMDTGLSPKTILDDLRNSEKHLINAGTEIELARTRIAIGDFYKKAGDHKKSRDYYKKAWEFFSTVDKKLFPPDLVSIMPKEEKRDLMANRIIEISESLGNIHDISLFLYKALNVVMDFTLAMRGAFLIIESGETRIIASRNVDHKFSDKNYLKTIKKIIIDMEKDSVDIIYPGLKKRSHAIGQKLIKAGLNSFICMPSKLGGKTFAYLCLDNRFGDVPFPLDSLPFLKILCTQIAVGLTNINMFNEMKELKERYESEALFYRQNIGKIGKSFVNIIGESKETLKLIDQVKQVAPTDNAVLILGETGVGKELVAKSIHNFSRRKDGPFFSVNLSVLPHDLVASELFGHEKGAFTGASEVHRGTFELANGGTIFLDEIGDLPANIQVKLLRVLEDRRFMRLGGNKQIESDFRILAATNKDLLSEIENGNFRQDLYFRLNVLPINIAPLRKRKDDIPILAKYFIDKFGNKTGKTIRNITEKEIQKLVDYHWPGNVRELKHAIERAIIMSDENNITFPKFNSHTLNQPKAKNDEFLSISALERRHITKILNATGWKVSGKDGAAKILDLKPSTLFYRMKKLGIVRPKASNLS